MSKIISVQIQHRLLNLLNKLLSKNLKCRINKIPKIIKISLLLLKKNDK